MDRHLGGGNEAQFHAVAVDLQTTTRFLANRHLGLRTDSMINLSLDDEKRQNPSEALSRYAILE